VINRSIILFAHERTDARVERRVRALTEHRWRVTGFTFHRPRPGRDNTPPFPNVHLGETRDRAYARRVLSLTRALGVLWRERALVRAADALYAVNTDNALLALAARLLSPKRPPVFLEIADIQPPFVSRGPAGRLLRWIERRVLARCACLVTTSPGFVRHYFGPLQHYAGPLFLLENKIFPSAGLAEERRAAPSPGPPWVIGWFGALRCRRSWEIMKRVAAALPDRVRFVLRGYPTALESDKFFREVAELPNIHFGGSYRYPGDLPEMHAGLHFVWALDFSDAGANSRWLLPNRVYESGLFHVPVLGATNTETGRWVEARGAGATIDSDAIEESLLAFVISLTPSRWSAMQKAAAAFPDTDFTGETDCASLSNRLQAAAAENPAQRSTPDRTYA
jgi:succinoglycan biosynthesis protein ExoL